MQGGGLLMQGAAIKARGCSQRIEALAISGRCGLRQGGDMEGCTLERRVKVKEVMELMELMELTELMEACRSTPGKLSLVPW